MSHLVISLKTIKLKSDNVRKAQKITKILSEKYICKVHAHVHTTQEHAKFHYNQYKTVRLAGLEHGFLGVITLSTNEDPDNPAQMCRLVRALTAHMNKEWM